jgi:hypothetical protein
MPNGENPKRKTTVTLRALSLADPKQIGENPEFVQKRESCHATD